MLYILYIYIVYIKYICYLCEVHFEYANIIFIFESFINMDLTNKHVVKRKLIDLPEDVIERLKIIADNKRMSVKAYIESLVIEVVMKSESKDEKTSVLITKNTK